MYYFVSYVWRKRGTVDHHISNAIIDVHPLDWIIKSREFESDYTLINYQEISEQDYFK